MKSTLFFFALMCACRSVIAQNIVANPTFATYVTCPSWLDGVSNGDCAFWTSPTKGTADYYHICSPTMHVPSNMVGYQPSASGSYVGILSYFPVHNTREYIQGKVPPLIPGQRYRVTVTVSLADSSAYGADGLGVLFYRGGRPDPSIYTVIPIKPQVDFSSVGPIMDKVNWTTLSDTFTADSAYTHLIIGNFKDDAILDTNKIPGNFILMPGAYYFIGSVAVEKDIDVNAVYVPLPAAQHVVTVFPDPVAASANFHVSSSISMQPWNLQIYNSAGFMLYSHLFNQQEVTLQTHEAGMSSGLYFYKIICNGQIYTGKFTML